MMKKFVLLTAGALVFSLTVTITGCKKEEDADCKTCRAFATNTQPEVTRQVCSPEEEQQFRSQYAGREVTCN